MQTSSGLLAHSAMFSPAPQTPSAPGGKKKLIYDQDHRGPLSTDTVATLMLLQADNIDLLGICTVSCDMWAKQETAYALRLLEIMGRPEIPVFMGAQDPLLNTKAEAQMRYQMFGSRSLGNEGYLGSFAKDAPGRDELAPLPPPMKITSLVMGTMSGASITASARFVIGPPQYIVTSLGLARIVRIMKSAAGSGWALIRANRL